MKFHRPSGVTFYDCINTIYQFIKPFLDNKMPGFEEYGDFKGKKKKKKKKLQRGANSFI